MKIIILEGIATSGKTTVIKELSKALIKRKASFSVMSEVETLLPLLDNKDKRKSIEFLKPILKKAMDKEQDLLIFDRLFFTHIFRTNCVIEDFREIENSIKDKATLIFLKIDEAKIPERINRARKHRDKDWNNYADKKGSESEVNNYYINQQRFLLKLTQDSSLNCKIYDTSNMNFNDIAIDIVKHF